MKQSKATSPGTLARLARQLHEANVPLTRVAAVAHVGISTVSNVLAGRRTSARVVATAKRLIEEAKRESVA